MNKKQGIFKFVKKFILLTALIILAGLAFIYRYQIYYSVFDFVKLHGYTPPSQISDLAYQDTMTDQTKHLFYLNKPNLIDNVITFRNKCPDNLNIVVLGCYHPGQNGIFIYQVNDPKLAGITQVTAAHEVLHAIYARLTPNAKKDLNNQLEAFYKNGLTDPTVKAEIELYIKTEPGYQFDEMSCTFGTEIANLPDGLNKYYSKYFANREVVVNYYLKYQTQFSSRITAINQYSKQLEPLNDQINTAKSNLSNISNQINALNTKLDQYRSNNNIAAYNSLIPQYNSLVDAYTSLKNSTNSLISQYNQLVNQRNAIVSELQSLNSAINTKILTN